MSGFRKATGEQAALKLLIFGGPGTAKTGLALLLAEGLSKLTGKRAAVSDTEHGIDFYVQDIPERKWHPKGFDVDVSYERSYTSIIKQFASLDPKEYGVAVLDSASHFYEATQDAFENVSGFGKWSKVSKPNKQLAAWMYSSPLHVVLVARETADMKKDDRTGELVNAGVKPAIHKTLAYDVNIEIHMSQVRSKTGDLVPTATVLKDRISVLQGKTIPWPTFENVGLPLLKYLGKKQPAIQSPEESAMTDVEAVAGAERERAIKSQKVMRDFAHRLDNCSIDAADDVGKSLTAEIKKEMLPDHVARCRQMWTNKKAGRPIEEGLSDVGEGS